MLHPSFSPPIDLLPPTKVEVEFQLATTPGSLPTDCSPWSETVVAVHAPLTSPPPEDITVHGTAAGFHISWTPRPGEEPVDRYGIVVWDLGTSLTHDVGVPVRSLGVRGRGTEVEVKRGRRYRVHVSTWCFGLGQGRGAWSRAVRGGSVGRPGRVEGVEVRKRGVGEVEVRWKGMGDRRAGEVVVWVRERGVRDGGPMATETRYVESDGDGISRVVVGGLRGRVEGYEFAVVLWNGDDEGERPEWVGVIGAGGVEVGQDDGVSIRLRLVV